MGVFNGAPRFLEIAVKPSGAGGAATLLSPRQPILSVPYAIRALNARAADTAANAAQLGGVAAGQFVQTNDPRLANGFIKDQTALQAGANFNIGGTGEAQIFDAVTQYNLGGNRVLYSNLSTLSLGLDAGINGIQNTFLGIGAGQATTPGVPFGEAGTGDTFVGTSAGVANKDGACNSFFGYNAGKANTSGHNNSFVGYNAGVGNTDGQYNSFFGWGAGAKNVNGWENVFLGSNAGGNSTGGNSNVFVGLSAGQGNPTANGNTFVGFHTGELNQIGESNTAVGYIAGPLGSSGGGNTYLGAGAQSEGNVTNAMAIGAGAKVTQSNSLVLGALAVPDIAPATKVGIGTTAPKTTLEVTGGKIFVGSPGQGGILKSPNGTVCRELTIDDGGAMKLNAVACP